jgi:hypothetical protein
MTMKIADVAPNEFMLVDLAEQLSRAESPDELKRTILDLDPSYLEAAKAMLESLSSEVASSNSYVQFPSEQVNACLEFDPVFAENARAILKEFIARKGSFKD